MLSKDYMFNTVKTYYNKFDLSMLLISVQFYQIFENLPCERDGSGPEKLDE